MNPKRLNKNKKEKIKGKKAAMPKLLEGIIKLILFILLLLILLFIVYKKIIGGIFKF